MKFKVIAAGFLVLCIITIASCSSPADSTPDLAVYFIDVGQGDSILIDFGTTEMLIDGGEKSPGVVDFLRDHVDGDLEFMVATHSDSDHIGGLTAVLENFKVDEVWWNGYTAASKTFTNWMAAVDAEGALKRQGVVGDTFTAGPLVFNVLNPPATLFKDANNNSIVLTLKFGSIGFIFTGDAEKEAEAAMLDQSFFPVPQVDILKVGHHGSRTASTSDFLDLIKPKTAVYMCGLNNKHGHPHQETIDALTARGVNIYGTENYGTITITTDGKTYEVKTER